MDIRIAATCDPRGLNVTNQTTRLGRNFRMDSAGYALAELLVLIAVISILCVIGFPLYLSYSRAQETDSAARVLVVSLNQARQLAVTRGLSYSVETQTNPSNRMRFCSGAVVPCPTAAVYTGPETDGSGWRKLENASRITLGPTITFSSLGAATAAGFLRVQNSTATGSLDVCVNPSGRIRVQAPGAACP